MFTKCIYMCRAHFLLKFIHVNLFSQKSSNQNEKKETKFNLRNAFLGRLRKWSEVNEWYPRHILITCDILETTLMIFKWYSRGVFEKWCHAFLRMDGEDDFWHNFSQKEWIPARFFNQEIIFLKFWFLNKLILRKFNFEIVEIVKTFKTWLKSMKSY